MYMDQKEKLEILEDENKLLKSSLKNVNVLCDSLKESNKLLVTQLVNLEEEIEKRLTTISKFLAKQGYQVEDIIEFENELIVDLKRRRNSES